MAIESVANQIPQSQIRGQHIDLTEEQWVNPAIPKEICWRMVRLHKVALALSGIARVIRADEANREESETHKELLYVPLSRCTLSELNIATEMLLSEAHSNLEDLPEVLAGEFQRVGRA